MQFPGSPRNWDSDDVLASRYQWKTCITKFPKFKEELDGSNRNHWIFGTQNVQNLNKNYEEVIGEWKIY